MRRLLPVSGFLICTMAGPAWAQLRVVNYNCAHLTGNLSKLQGVFAALNTDDKPGFAVAPHVYVFQEVQTSDASTLLTRLNAAAPAGVSYTLGTFTSTSTENNTVGAQALFYRADVLSEDPAAHADIYSGASRSADRWKLRLVGYDSPDAAFYIYSAHLKASSGTSEAAERLAGATAIRDDADSLPAGTHILYAGDFNLYSNAESAYVKFLSAGNGQAFDPLGAGSWSGSGNAIKHTQSPYNANDTGNPSGLVTGGMDDRFDFQLGTSAWDDGDGLARIAGAYRVLGNDANHYNKAIDVTTNSYYPGDLPRSNALAVNLAGATDHLPVVCDYQKPAVASATLPASFGRVIENTPLSVTLTVSNAAAAMTPAGADELDYVATTDGVLGGGGSGSINALAAPVNIGLSVNTTIVGSRSGSAHVTSASQAAQNSAITRSISGTVLRRSNPSFSAGNDIDAATASMVLAPNSGQHQVTVAVYNLAFDADQAALDVDAVTGVALPFAFVGGLQAGVAGLPATLTFGFDTSGRACGMYHDTVSIQTSDENIPGAVTASLSLFLHVEIVPPPGDFDCSGRVDTPDVPTFVAVLLGVDTLERHVALADLNGDAVADARDIQLFIDALLS